MQRDALALPDVWHVAPGGAVLGVLVAVGNVAMRGGGDTVTLQIGDKVKVVNNDIEWTVFGVAAGCVYLKAISVPAWAPQRYSPDKVTHVWRGNEWVPVSPPDCTA